MILAIYLEFAKFSERKFGGNPLSGRAEFTTNFSTKKTSFCALENTTFDQNITQSVGENPTKMPLLLGGAAQPSASIHWPLASSL